MANIVYNIAKGRGVELYNRVKAGDLRGLAFA
jgi:phage head maturation protease